MPRRAARLTLAVLLLGACQHLALPEPAYRLRVENRTDRVMVVTYQDEQGTGVLGSVRAGRTGRFILSDVASSRITVSARSDDGSRTSGPYPLTLNATAAGTVVLE